MGPLLAPTYLSILPAGSSPTTDLYEFLGLLSKRMGLLAGRGQYDYQRAATFFINWWRKNDGMAENTDLAVSRGWGFDFQWPAERDGDLAQLMDRCHREFEEQVEREEKEGNMISDAQKERTAQEEKAQSRKKRYSDMPAKERPKWAGTSSNRGKRR